MISLDTFALSSKTLDRSLLEDFLRGEIDSNRSKVVEPICSFRQTYLQGEPSVATNFESDRHHFDLMNACPFRSPAVHSRQGCCG